MGKKYKIMCLNTGEIYQSIAAAAQAEGVNRSSITRQLTGEIKSVKGKVYCYYTDEISKLDPDEMIRMRKQALNQKFGIVLRKEREEL